MKHLRIPREITLAEMKAKDVSWSAGMYQRVEIPNSNQRKVGELLEAFHNGNEVGSLSYVRSSPCSFVRTKALQSHSFLTQFKGGAVVPITPRAFNAAIERNPERQVNEGDVLYARGGNVGEVAFAYQCGLATLSGHMLRLRFAAQPLYGFAFLKHEICKLQQRSNVAGSIAALDNFKIETLLNCRIPFPAQRDADDVVAYVAAITETIIEKEKANRGDLILGCEGFSKGRSLVLVDAPERCTTNFHGTVLFWPGAELWQTIFVRCFLAYLREHGVIDWVGVGGSGGHMSPDYFDYLPFPRFPDAVRERIARLYHNPIPEPKRKPTLANFVATHRHWNEGLGIWELDREMKALQQTLAALQEEIIEGRTVKLPF